MTDYRTHTKKTSKILRLMAEKYPIKEAVYEKLIYLQSYLSLPKGIEHFMSDLHGEYASFSTSSTTAPASSARRSTTSSACG